MPDPLDCWAVVEVMGRTRYAGKVTEQVIAGAAFVRLDVPATPALLQGERVISEAVAAFTRYIGAASIFAITPTTEAEARNLARLWGAMPVDLWESKKAQQLALCHQTAEGVQTDGEAFMEIVADDEIPFA